MVGALSRTSCSQEEAAKDNQLNVELHLEKDAHDEERGNTMDGFFFSVCLCVWDY